MKKNVLFLGLFLQSALYGAAFSPNVTTASLEGEIAKAIKSGSPAAGIVENLERLAILYDAKGDAFGQLAALQKISSIKGLTKDKKAVNDIRVASMFKELENALNQQIDQTADKRAHYQAQVMLGRLCLMRNEQTDRERAESLLKAAIKQKDYPDITHEAYISLGDFNVARPDATSQAFAKEFYNLVPETNADLWPLAQAKLGVLLMKQAERASSDDEKQRLTDEASAALVNGIKALNDKSFVFDERMAATYLAAKRLQMNDKWEEAANYFSEVANNSTNDAERFRSNINIALILQRNQPLLAPIYFKRVYEQASPMKDIDSATQLFVRLTAAKELANLELGKSRISQNIVKYLQFAVTQADALIDFLVKNKRKFLDKVPGVIRNFLAGSYGLSGIIRSAEKKASDDTAIATELNKISSSLKRVDERLEALEEKGIEL